MECANVRDERELYAAGGCLPERREEIRRHVDGCPPCAAELAETERFVAMLDREIKHVAPSIEQRPVVRRFPIARWGWAIARGAAACVVVALLLYYLLSRESAPEVWAGPNLSAQVTGPSELKLKWTPLDRAVREYRVERSTDEKNFTEISRVGGDVNAFTDEGLATGMTYYYRVGAVTDGETADFSNIASVRIGPLHMSTRGYVGKGQDRMVAGIVIGGMKERKICIRARGPSMVDGGIKNALADPLLTIYSNQKVVARNDNWRERNPLGEQEGYRCGTPEEIVLSGLAPEGTGSDRESVILITLPPGAYTAALDGVDGGTGIGIIGVFEIE